MTKANSIANVISAKSLSKRYSDVLAVDDLSLDLRRGECLAILGPNGAGKTTLLDLIEGLQKPDAGSVEIFGLQLEKSRQSILRRIGVVLQDSNLYKRMTIQETWELFASFFVNSASVQVLADQLGLREKLGSQLRHLSGGEKQRAYLGTALIGNPEILFLDEPTTGLDPHARRKIWHLVQALQSSGMSMILTTHNMDEAAQLAHRVIIMFKGKIVDGGEPKALIRQHCGTDVVEISSNGEGILLQEIVAKFAKKYSLQPEIGSLNIFCDSLDDAMKTAKFVSEFADSKKSPLQALQVRRATLEDVFILKTGSALNAND